VAFRWTSSTAVAAGTFNMYVIQPHWLTEVGRFREGMKLKAKSDMNRPGFNYSSDELRFTWDIRPDRLMVISKGPTDDCGAELADVIEKLPWTPLAGVGANVEFTGDEADIELLMSGKCRLPSCNIPDGYGLKQRTVHIAIARDAHIFNLQIAAHERVELSINVHTELTAKGRQAANSELAQRACKQHLALCHEATELARNLFQVELRYEPNSD